MLQEFRVTNDAYLQTIALEDIADWKEIRRMEISMNNITSFPDVSGLPSLQEVALFINPICSDAPPDVKPGCGSMEVFI